MTLTIAGTDRTSRFKRGTLTITYSANHRAVAEFTTVDRAASSPYRPALGDTVSISHSSTTLFAGIVTGLANEPRARDRGAVVRVTCADYHTYATWRIVRNVTYTTGQSLKTVLQDLVTDYLTTPYSVTNDAGMAAGSTQPALAFDGKRLDEVFTELCDKDGWVWEITDAKVFKAYAHGARSPGSPAAFTDSDTHTVKVGWRQEREVGGYANIVYVRYKNNAEVTRGSSAEPHEVIVSAPAVSDATQAANIGDARLSRLSASAKEISLTTTQNGYRPGQSVTVNFPDQGLTSLTCYISEVVTRDHWPRKGATSTKLLLHEVTAIESTALPSDWRDFYGGSVGNPGGSIASIIGGVSGVAGPIYVHLGGSRQIDVATVAYADLPDAVDVDLDSADFSGRTPVVRLMVRSRGTTQVKVRLYNVDDATDMGDTGWIASGTTWTAATISGLTLTTGVKTYRLQIIGNNATYGVQAIGYLEA